MTYEPYEYDGEELMGGDVGSESRSIRRSLTAPADDLGDRDPWLEEAEFLRATMPDDVVESRKVERQIERLERNSEEANTLMAKLATEGEDFYERMSRGR